MDKSGPILVKLVEEAKVGEVKETLCVPDNQQEIRYVHGLCPIMLYSRYIGSIWRCIEVEFLYITVMFSS